MLPPGETRWVCAVHPMKVRKKWDRYDGWMARQYIHCITHNARHGQCNKDKLLCNTQCPCSMHWCCLLTSLLTVTLQQPTKIHSDTLLGSLFNLESKPTEESRERETKDATSNEYKDPAVLLNQIPGLFQDFKKNVFQDKTAVIYSVCRVWQHNPLRNSCHRILQNSLSFTKFIVNLFQ